MQLEKRWGSHFLEWSDGHLLYGDILDKGQKIILAVLFFDACRDEDDIGFPIDAGIYDPLSRVVRYLVVPRDDGFVIEKMSLGRVLSGAIDHLPKLHEPLILDLPGAGGGRLHQVPVASLHDALLGFEVSRELTGETMRLHVSIGGVWRTVEAGLLDDVIVRADVTDLEGDAGSSRMQAAPPRPVSDDEQHLLASASRPAMLAWETPDAPASETSQALPTTHGLTIPVSSRAIHLCGRADIPGSSAFARMIGRNIPEVDQRTRPTPWIVSRTIVLDRTQPRH